LPLQHWAAVTQPLREFKQLPVAQVWVVLEQPWLAPQHWSLVEQVPPVAVQDGLSLMGFPRGGNSSPSPLLPLEQEEKSAAVPSRTMNTALKRRPKDGLESVIKPPRFPHLR
jgi:hypothetical protein